MKLIYDIEKVQKRATKMLYMCRGKSYIERLRLLNLPCLRFRRLRGDMIEVYKILNNMYDPCAVPNLNRNHDTRNRGHTLKLNTVGCKYDVRKFSFCNRVVNVWNSLPEHIVTSPSVNAFKNALDKLWCDEDFYLDYKGIFPGLYNNRSVL